MGYYIIKKGRILVCRGGDRLIASENNIACTHITQKSAEDDLKKLEGLGIKDYQVLRGCCKPHFDYNKRAEVEYG